MGTKTSEGLSLGWLLNCGEVLGGTLLVSDISAAFGKSRCRYDMYICMMILLHLAIGIRGGERSLSYHIWIPVIAGLDI